MLTIVRGVHYDIGDRELYEDRVTALQLNTAGELLLDVAIVADGVGGENKGERAAQLAVDACVEYLQNSTLTNPAELVAESAQAANAAVYKIFQDLEGASTTLSVAIIYEGRLYIANVGDSRIYLVRDNHLTQLTLDHTFENLVPIQGKMSPEKARNYPSAQVIMRALGPKSQVPIDIGLHFDTTNFLTREAYMYAQEMGQAGLELQIGDSVLICSDGLIREVRKTGQPATTTEEIVQVLTTQAGEKAARSLVSFALGRDSDDNISVAVLQNLDDELLNALEHSNGGIPPRSFRTFMIGAGIAVFALIAFALIGSFVLFRNISASTNENQELEERNTRIFETAQAAQVANQNIRATSEMATINWQRDFEADETREAIIAMTETAQPTNTPIPTATPRAPLKPDQIGAYFVGISTNPTELFEDDPINERFRVEFQINHTDEDLPSGSVYAFPDSEVEFKRVDRRVELEIFKGSRIFIESGRYGDENGAEVELDPDNVVFTLLGSCMAVDYPAEEDIVIGSCYDGTCRYEINREATLINRGESIQIDLTSMEVEVAPISQPMSVEYETLLTQSSDGEADAAKCLPRYLPPTPTATPTATIFVPTRTLEPTDTPTPTSTPTATPRSSSSGNPTTIVAVSPSSTPLIGSQQLTITATNTRRPTNTPRPTSTLEPTDTIRPSLTPRPTNTNTLVPTSTNTLIPTSTNTPIPTSTNTPPPSNTNTPTPAPTDTPTTSPADATNPNRVDFGLTLSFLFAGLTLGFILLPHRKEE